jgi:hypothetical protein
MRSLIIILAMFATTLSVCPRTFAQQQIFGPANSRPNLGTNGPGRAANLPPAGGSLNGNSVFQVTTSPFTQNSLASMVDDELALKTANERVREIRRVFRWAGEEEMLSADPPDVPLGCRE